MAEQPPSSSSDDTNDNNKNNTNHQSSLTLSPPQEPLLDELQTQEPKEQLPKLETENFSETHKCSAVNEAVTEVSDVLGENCELGQVCGDVLSLGDGKSGVLGCDLEKLGGDFERNENCYETHKISAVNEAGTEVSDVLGGNSELGQVCGDGKSGVLGCELEKLGGDFKGNEVSVECVNGSKAEEFDLGVSCDDFSEKKIVGFELQKKNDKNSEKSDPEIGGCLENKIVADDDVSKGNGTSVKLMNLVGNQELVAFEKNEKFGGFLNKLVKSDGNNLNGKARTCSLKIEVIDETALVDVLKIDGKKNKRRGNKKVNSNSVGATNGGIRKFVYSRKEMEVLRYVNVKGQKKFWKEIYCGFEQTVKREYDELGSFRHNNKPGDRRQVAQMRNYTDQGILGESSSENVSCDAEMIGSMESSCVGEYSGNDADDLVGEQSEHEVSDDEYENMQRPAFWVEGEPDFESGPPEDGLEYLRRVRWEASHIPKVKVAKIDTSKLNKEQSVYMPRIPDIEQCPPHLLPLKQWEDEFVIDFSELRMALSCIEDTSDTMPDNPQTIIFGHQECPSRSSESSTSLEFPSGGPTLSAVLAMDPVTRVTMLKRRISLFDSASDPSKDDYAWLFALCAVIDTPLDADTSASLRCLLRRCAKLRAGKSEFDDEVVMLNVLATISGKYFGQSEK